MLPKEVFVDAVVVGGGLQGLAVLRMLRESGFDAILISEGELGDGQSLLNHGWLHGGICIPGAANMARARAALDVHWRPLLAKSGIDFNVHARDSYFALSSARHDGEVGEWHRENGLASAALGMQELPECTHGGLMSPLVAKDEIRILRAYDAILPKDQAVRALAEGLEGCIVRGRVVGIEVRLNEQTAECAPSATVEHVLIRAESVGGATSAPPPLFHARSLFVCAGVGTRGVLSTLTVRSSATSAADTVLGLPAADAPCTSTAERLPPETLSAHQHIRTIHMVALRGAGLARFSLFAPETPGLIIASMPSTEEGEFTWLVTPRAPDPTVATGAWVHETLPGDAKARVSSDLVRLCLERLYAVCPAVHALAPSLEFSVWAGHYQDFPHAQWQAECKPVEWRGRALPVAVAVPNAHVKGLRRSSRGCRARPGGGAVAHSEHEGRGGYPGDNCRARAPRYGSRTRWRQWRGGGGGCATLGVMLMASVGSGDRAGGGASGHTDGAQPFARVVFF
jgi:glycine/D-amino acid oxidase-like deaminating enzyme